MMNGNEFEFWGITIIEHKRMTMMMLMTPLKTINMVLAILCTCTMHYSRVSLLFAKSILVHFILLVCKEVILLALDAIITEVSLTHVCSLLICSNGSCQ
jgi:hypothetical protein